MTVIGINDFHFHSTDKLTWYEAHVGRYQSSTGVNSVVRPVCLGKSLAKAASRVSLQKLENKQKTTPTTQYSSF